MSSNYREHINLIKIRCQISLYTPYTMFNTYFNKNATGNSNLTNRKLK